MEGYTNSCGYVRATMDVYKVENSDMSKVELELRRWFEGGREDTIHNTKTSTSDVQVFLDKVIENQGGIKQILELTSGNVDLGVVLMLLKDNYQESHQKKLDLVKS